MENSIDLSEYFLEPKKPDEIEKDLEDLNLSNNYNMPWHKVDPSVSISSEEESSQRFSVCLSCPELIKETSTCKQCGCFMFLKTKLKDAKCPLNKW